MRTPASAPIDIHMRTYLERIAELEVDLAIERESNEAFSNRIEVLYKENQRLKERMEIMFKSFSLEDFEDWFDKEGNSI